jgi:hypothetical protein
MLRYFQVWKSLIWIRIQIPIRNLITEPDLESNEQIISDMSGSASTNIIFSSTQMMKPSL